VKDLYCLTLHSCITRHRGGSSTFTLGNGSGGLGSPNGGQSPELFANHAVFNIKPIITEFSSLTLSKNFVW